MKLHLDQIESALDNGGMLARMANGALWTCRRNGRTQTWKTRPDEFRIPVKAGFRAFRACGEITQESDIALASDNERGADFIVESWFVL